MADFTTLANVKAVLGVPAGVTRHDAKINLYLGGIDAEMLSLLGQSAITSTVYSETYDVDGPRERSIQLRHWPATSLGAVTDDGSAVAADNLYIDPETRSFVRLIGSGSFFTEGRQKVVVTYTAGQPIPGDLTTAATLLVVHKVNAGGHAGLGQESSGGYSYTVADGEAAYAPPSVMAIINRRKPLLR
jgi:hypothetical protein